MQAIPQALRIGGHPNPALQTVEQPLQAGDLIILIGLSDIELIGEEFLKLSLARFGDNPSTALRQINTRVAHTGRKTKPTLIFVQCISPGDQPGGWFHSLLSP